LTARSGQDKIEDNVNSYLFQGSGMVNYYDPMRRRARMTADRPSGRP
jgi:hypothetical protein